MLLRLEPTTSRSLTFADRKFNLRSAKTEPLLLFRPVRRTGVTESLLQVPVDLLYDTWRPWRPWRAGRIEMRNQLALQRILVGTALLVAAVLLSGRPAQAEAWRGEERPRIRDGTGPQPESNLRQIFGGRSPPSEILRHTAPILPQTWANAPRIAVSNRAGATVAPQTSGRMPQIVSFQSSARRSLPHIDGHSRHISPTYTLGVTFCGAGASGRGV